MIIQKTIYCYLIFSIKIVISFLSYLTNRTWTIKIDSTFSDWTNIVKVILQVSILRLLLFNICINYLLLFSVICEICNFADGNSLYSRGMNLDNIFTNITQDTLKIGDITAKPVSSVTLIGNTLKNTSIIEKKLCALRRIRKFLTQEKAKILACPMIESQFL